MLRRPRKKAKLTHVELGFKAELTRTSPHVHHLVAKRFAAKRQPEQAYPN